MLLHRLRLIGHQRCVQPHTTIVARAHHHDRTLVSRVQVAGVLVPHLASTAAIAAIVVSLVEHLCLACDRLVVQEVHGGVLILEVAALAVRWAARRHGLVHGGERASECAIVNGLCVQFVRHHVFVLNAIGDRTVVIRHGLASLTGSGSQWGMVIGQPTALCSLGDLLLLIEEATEAVVQEVLG